MNTTKYTPGSMSSTFTNFKKESSQKNDEEKKEQLIDDDLIFKCAMTRDYNKVQELSIVSEGLTYIDNGNLIVR